MFFEENAKLLEAFAKVSGIAGARADYVQGGGGNTSVKLGGGLMAIKASGFCLSDITPNSAYAVLDGAAIRDFYLTSEPEQFENVETAGSNKAKESVKVIEGLQQLRPSVEAGFHSILKTFVVHTHSVYANLAACAVNCKDICTAAFEGADYSWGMVPYVDPGANLTFAIRDEMKRVEAETGKKPGIIIMQNHGIIAHDDDPETVLQLHADANERLAKAFGITGDSFPKVSVREIEPGLYEADTPYLTEALKGGAYTEQFLLEQPLYPDQMVFLIGTFSMDKAEVEDGQCIAYSDSGKVLMRMDAKKAQVLAETLTAVVFVINHIKAAGHPLSTMGEKAKSFIANWESEKYRKSLAGKK
ncbi:MAG: class II aldolase/adducin family protein [Ruminococcaceae bacterium]|nr:class II aldolase/adducin family protein [Oscillospiraceae bacterium]